MPFGWGIVSTGKHPDIKIAPAMAAAYGGELVGVYSRDQHRAEAFAQKHHARAAYSQLGDLLKDSRVDGVFVVSHHCVSGVRGGEPSRPRTPNAHCAWASTMRPSVPAARARARGHRPGAGAS